MRGRFIAELAVVAGDAELLDEAHRRKQLGLVEQHLRENLVVEEIEAPRAEPDDVDDENCRRDEQDRDRAETVLQRRPQDGCACLRHSLDSLAIRGAAGDYATKTAAAVGTALRAGGPPFRASAILRAPRTQGVPCPTSAQC